MKRHSIFICLLAACTMMPAQAQKRKATAKKKAQPVVVKTEQEMKFDHMLNATQRIIIIDSIVVDKQQFLNAFKLTAEAGKLEGYNQFFHSDEQPYSVVYLNQLGNKCWFANSGRLFTADLLGQLWSEPQPLIGLGNFQRTNYPFVLADGTTLYFAAIGEQGLGGLDVYMTRYDSESRQYLLAENIGLPFNSDANDYMYAIDEFTGIGYFASDRRQPEGKVCIYTFIPNQKRVIYPADEMEESKLRSLAKIERIADTWGDGQERQAALQRLKSAQSKTNALPEKDMAFVIADGIVYTRISDFHGKGNRERAKRLVSMMQQHQELDKELDKARQYYATKADPNEKAALQDDILVREQEFYQLERDILQLEKDIRKAEAQSQ